MGINLKKIRRLAAVILSVAVSIAFLCIMAVALFQFNSDMKQKQLEVIKQAVNKAVISCYALEGSYPPDIKYLQDNYGLIVDKKNYIYDYQIFASNIPPVIYIFPVTR